MHILNISFKVSRRSLIVNANNPQMIVFHFNNIIYIDFTIVK